MEEFGRFKKGAKTFYGLVEENKVTELIIENKDGDEKNYDLGAVESWNELVILPPCEPNKIILSELYQYDFLLRAPSSLLPHRNMISLPFPEHHNYCEGGLAFVLGKEARRIKAKEVSDYLWGYATLQSIKDATQKSKTQAYSYDTFMPFGPTLRSEVSRQGKMELWHNGELKQQATLQSFLDFFPEWIAYISDAMTLWPGDIIALTVSENAPLIKPGDHLEVHIPSLRSLATNVGMRGSA